MPSGVEEDWASGVQISDGQVTRHISVYRNKITFREPEGYVYPMEYWVQTGNRETPCHVDHGRNVAFIPPCCSQSFRVWVVYADPEARMAKRCKWSPGSFAKLVSEPDTIVLIQRAGDVICI